MNIKKNRIYLANLDPRMGTEPGKKRPVVVIQTDLLNDVHASTLICPVTTNVVKEATVLRVHLNKKENGLKKSSDILVDQIRAIDNKRFTRKLGALTQVQTDKLKENLAILLFE